MAALYALWLFGKEAGGVFQIFFFVCKGRLEVLLDLLGKLGAIPEQVDHCGRRDLGRHHIGRVFIGNIEVIGMGRAHKAAEVGGEAVGSAMPHRRNP